LNPLGDTIIMIDKRMYALNKWIKCKIWGCHNCPTDDWNSMAKCIVCKRNELREKNKKSMFEKHKGY